MLIPLLSKPCYFIFLLEVVTLQQNGFPLHALIFLIWFDGDASKTWDLCVESEMETGDGRDGESSHIIHNPVTAVCGLATLLQQVPANSSIFHSGKRPATTHLMYDNVLVSPTTSPPFLPLFLHALLSSPSNSQSLSFSLSSLSCSAVW